MASNNEMDPFPVNEDLQELANNEMQMNQFPYFRKSYINATDIEEYQRDSRLFLESFERDPAHIDRNSDNIMRIDNQVLKEGDFDEFQG